MAGFIVFMCVIVCHSVSHMYLKSLQWITGALFGRLFRMDRLNKINNDGYSLFADLEHAQPDKAEKH